MPMEEAGFYVRVVKIFLNWAPPKSVAKEFENMEGSKSPFIILGGVYGKWWFMCSIDGSNYHVGQVGHVHTNRIQVGIFKCAREHLFTTSHLFFKLRYKSKFQMDGYPKWYVDTLPYDLRCGSQLIRSRPSSLWAAISNDLHDLCSGINSSMDYNINHLELESKFCSNSAARHKALSHRPKKPAAWNNISKTWLIC